MSENAGAVNHGNLKWAASAEVTIEELREQNVELLHRLGKCTCEQTLAEPEPSQPFDEMAVIW